MTMTTIKQTVYKRFHTHGQLFEKNVVYRVSSALATALKTNAAFIDGPTTDLVDGYTGLAPTALRTPAEVATTPGTPSNPRYVAPKSKPYTDPDSTTVYANPTWGTPVNGSGSSDVFTTAADITVGGNGAGKALGSVDLTHNYTFKLKFADLDASDKIGFFLSSAALSNLKWTSDKTTVKAGVYLSGGELFYTDGGYVNKHLAYLTDGDTIRLYNASGACKIDRMVINTNGDGQTVTWQNIASVAGIGTTGQVYASLISGANNAVVSLKTSFTAGS